MFLDDNDYSDSFLVKIKMKTKESKSEYDYYLLANADLTIENISSSAINLGLTLDLLKKYVVKIDILIRTENNKVFNIYDNYRDYKESLQAEYLSDKGINPSEVSNILIVSENIITKNIFSNYRSCYYRN